MSSATNRRQHLVVKMFVALLIAPLFALLFSTLPAGAASTAGTNSNGTQTALICSRATAATLTATDNLLPVNRWSGAIGNEHTRLPGGLFSSVTNAPNTINRSIFVGGMTSIGAAEWQLGVATTEAAAQFCFANTVGQDANSLAATLGNAVSSSGLVAILAVIALLAIIWKASRGRESPLRQAGKIIVIVALFSAIVAAATVKTAPNSPPTPISPAWFITTAYTAISNISSAPASAIASAANKVVGGSSQQTISAQDPLSCDWYTQELVTQYQKTYSNANSYGYVVPVSMNSLWEQAALPAYTSEQFGNNNNFGPLVYCHLLEDQAAISPASQLKVAQASGALSGDSNLASFPHPQATSLAWNGAITNDQEDESMVAWAACQSPNSAAGFVPSEWDLTTGAKVPSVWTTVTNPNAQQGSTQSDTTVSGADCQVFWSANAPASGGQFGDAVSGGPFSNPSGAPWTGQISNPDYSVFNVGDNPTTIAGAANSSNSGQEIGNFLSNLHGTSNASAMATSFIFLLSSTVVMVIFLVLGLAVIVAKLGLLLSMAVMPLALLLALMPGGSGTGKFGAYAKHLFGLILFATSAGALLSFIAIITAMLSDIGVAAAGRGSLFALIWVAIAPVTAIWVCHKFFTKILRSPSPFKPTSAMAYGAALGGFGGGLVGVDLFSHMRRQGSNAVSIARNRMSGQSTKRGSDQRGRGRHSMGGGGSGGGAGGPSPSGRGPTGAGPSGIGAGVVAGATTGDVKQNGVGPDATGAPVPTRTPTGPVNQSMFGKRERRQRRVEGVREQREADTHVRGERVASTTKRLEQLKGSLLNPSATRHAVTEATKTRVKASLKQTKDRFNQKDSTTGDNHRIRGSLLTAAAGASSAAAGVRRLPKIAKYGALGVAGAAAIGLGAPAVAGAGILLGAKKLRNHARNAPIRQSQRLQSYQTHLTDQEAAATSARAAQNKAAEKANEEQVKVSEKAEADRREAEVQTAEQRAQEQQARVQAEHETEVRTAQQRAKERQAREQAERDAQAREKRVRDWQRGEIGPRRGGSSSGPQGPRRIDSPFSGRDS